MERSWDLHVQTEYEGSNGGNIRKVCRCMQSQSQPQFYEFDDSKLNKNADGAEHMLLKSCPHNVKGTPSICFPSMPPPPCI